MDLAIANTYPSVLLYLMIFCLESISFSLGRQQISDITFVTLYAALCLVVTPIEHSSLTYQNLKHIASVK